MRWFYHVTAKVNLTSSERPEGMAIHRHEGRIWPLVRWTLFSLCLVMCDSETISDQSANVQSLNDSKMTTSVQIDTTTANLVTSDATTGGNETKDDYTTDIPEYVTELVTEIDEKSTAPSEREGRPNGQDENYQTEIITEIVFTETVETERTRLYDDSPTEISTPGKNTSASNNPTSVTIGSAVEEKQEEYVTEITEIIYTVDMGTEIVTVDNAPVADPQKTVDGTVGTSTPGSKVPSVTENGEDYLTEVVTEIDEIVYTEILGTERPSTNNVTNWAQEKSRATKAPHNQTAMEKMTVTEVNEVMNTIDLRTEMKDTGVGSELLPRKDDVSSLLTTKASSMGTSNTSGTDITTKKYSATLVEDHSQVATTEAIDLEDSHLYFQFVVDNSVNITDPAFVLDLEQKLAKVIESTEPGSTQNRRRRKRSPNIDNRLSDDKILFRERRALNEDIIVKVRNLIRNTKDSSILDIYFTVEVNGTTIPSTEAAARFAQVSSAKMSAVLGHEVLSVPVAVNVPEAIVSPTDKFEPPSGDLGDFLMIVLLVPLNVDIGGPVFQTDVAHGLEAIYLTGVEMSSRGRRRRETAGLDGRDPNISYRQNFRVESGKEGALLDGRIMDVVENGFDTNVEDTLYFETSPRRNVEVDLNERALYHVEKLRGGRRRRASIANPSDEYSVNLKSVHRPVQTQMEVEIVFSVILNEEVVTGKDALVYFSKVSIMFMKEVLVYHVKEPGVFLFQLEEDSTIWIIIFIDIAVVIILLIILIVYCRYAKYKKSERHKQAILNKKERSTSIEVGFVRIGVPTEDQAALENIIAHEKSASHAMHGTVRDKLNKKRKKKGSGGYGSSSDEETTVRPSQLFVAGQDTQALIAASEDGTNGQEFVRRFKKRDHDESIRKQQELQDQLNQELARRLGASRPSNVGEPSGLQQQVGEMMEEAGGFGIADKISSVLSDVMEFLGFGEAGEKLPESDSSSWSSSEESYTSEEEDEYREEELP